MDSAEGHIGRLLGVLRAIGEERPDLTVGQLRELLNDPARREEDAPLLRQISKALGPTAADASAAISRVLPLVRQASRAAVRFRETAEAAVRSLVQATKWAARLPEMVPVAFEPYRREIEIAGEGNIPPLTIEQQASLLATALLSWRPAERTGGALPPLEQVAFIAGRYDIAIAVLHRRHPRVATRLAQAFPNREFSVETARAEAEADLWLVLDGDFFRRIWKRVGKQSPESAWSELPGLLSEQYIYASLCHARLEALGREDWLNDRRDAEFDLEEAPGSASSEGTQVRRLVVRDAVSDYLAGSSNPHVDRQIIEALAARKSMPELARELGVPRTTLSSRKQKLVECLKRRLEEELPP